MYVSSNDSKYNHLFCFTFSPDHRPAYFFVCEFDFNNLESGENLQEHKARAGDGPCE